MFKCIDSRNPVELSVSMVILNFLCNWFVSLLDLKKLIFGCLCFKEFKTYRMSLFSINFIELLFFILCSACFKNK